MIKISRDYLYRIGPHSLIVAFSHYLGDSRVKQIKIKKLYKSKEDIQKSLRNNQGILRQMMRDGVERKILLIFSDHLKAARTLLQMPKMRYPVVLIGLDRATKDDIDFFEDIGYKQLQIQRP